MLHIYTDKGINQAMFKGQKVFKYGGMIDAAKKQGFEAHCAAEGIEVIYKDQYEGDKISLI